MILLVLLFFSGVSTVILFVTITAVQGYHFATAVFFQMYFIPNVTVQVAIRPNLNVFFFSDGFQHQLYRTDR